MENNNIQGTPFMGRLVDAERTEGGVLVQIPYDMLDYAGLQEKSKWKFGVQLMER